MAESTLQIRLPEGKVVKNTFQATDTIETVMLWLKNSHKFPDGAVLQNSYPRTVFDSAKLKQTLKEAGLVPNASLVVNLATKEQAHKVNDLKSSSDKSSVFDFFKSGSSGSTNNSNNSADGMSRAKLAGLSNSSQTSGSASTQRKDTTDDRMSKANVHGFKHK